MRVEMDDDLWLRAARKMKTDPPFLDVDYGVMAYEDFTSWADEDGHVLEPWPDYGAGDRVAVIFKLPVALYLRLAKPEDVRSFENEEPYLQLEEDYRLWLSYAAESKHAHAEVDVIYYREFGGEDGYTKKVEV